VGAAAARSTVSTVSDGSVMLDACIHASHYAAPAPPKLKKRTPWACLVHGSAGRSCWMPCLHSCMHAMGQRTRAGTCTVCIAHSMQRTLGPPSAAALSLRACLRAAIASARLLCCSSRSSRGSSTTDRRARTSLSCRCHRSATVCAASTRSASLSALK
jgi:hypothetical protein